MRPQLAPRLRVEGDHAAERGAQVQGSLEQDRRRFEVGLPRVLAAVRDVAGAVGPGHLEVTHVLAVDLVQRRVAHPADVAAVVAPAGDETAPELELDTAPSGQPGQPDRQRQRQQQSGERAR